MKTYSNDYSDNDEDCSCSSCECSSSKSLEHSGMNIEHIYQIIDQSYTKIPILYNSINQTKLDKDFILSVNDYLDRLKSNIYKDLIRRETLLRNGKNHARNLISLIRCICKISSEQAHDIAKNSNVSKHPAIYTMTAIDYILQSHFPQKKPLFNYILNEYISMWLHENLRTIQEDFSVIVENGTENNFLLLSTCLLNKLESICAINWERLQMIQNYRLTHFDQLMKPTNKDLILLFGKSSLKKSEIPITLLYSNRTDNELTNINEMHHIFRKSIAKILIRQRITPVSVNKKLKEKFFFNNYSIHIHRSSSPNDGSLSHSSPSTVSDRSKTTDPKAILNTEVNELIHFLTELANSPSSINGRQATSPLVEQLESRLKENNTDPKLIIEKIRLSHSQTSFNVKDPLFLAEFTRILRKELEDAQMLREIDRGQLNEDSRNIGYLSFETSNILKLPRMNTSLKKEDITADDHIDQNRIFIEVTHDPSKCSPKSDGIGNVRMRIV